MKIRFLIPFILCFLFFACVSPPDYPIEPRLTLNPARALSKNSVLTDVGISKRDSLKITVEFTDGDGDLGVKNDSSLFIIDTRFNTRANDAIGLLRIPEQGASNGVSGDIYITLYGGCCRGTKPCNLDNDRARDTVVYEIYIKDRAGHESNHVKTPPIAIICK